MYFFPTVLEGNVRFVKWRHPEAGDRGGGARQKMASLRCRRDPCGVICLILTYFSVFYADYVVIQYVLIPAYSDRSVLCVFMSFKPLKKTDMASAALRCLHSSDSSILTLFPPLLRLKKRKTCFSDRNIHFDIFSICLWQLCTEMVQQDVCLCCCCCCLFTSWGCWSAPKHSVSCLFSQ